MTDLYHPALPATLCLPCLQGEDAAGGDLSSLVQALASEGAAGDSAAAQRRFEKGDTVLVIDGDLRNAKGVVERVGEDGQVYVALQDDLGVVGHRPQELSKYFEVWWCGSGGCG